MTIRIYFLQVITLAAVTALIYFVIQQRFENADALLGEEAEILLYDENNLEELITLLENTEVVFDPDELRWAAIILRTDRFLPGRYYLDGGKKYKEFLGKLHRGEEDPKMVIIHPGQTYDRFYNRVAAQFRFSAQELRDAMRDSAYIRSELALEPHLLFGRMIPNTYEFFWTATPQQFLSRMLREYERAVSNLRETAESMNLTMDEVLTFASIVELEALYDHEKPKIAGLYWNRINQGWRLQADPTVGYALGRRGRLTFRDYRTQHPYNTYVIRGLPPGPITNPAMSSIRAVLEPESHPYMFMVATPEGVHSFTRTYPEHQRESAKWRDYLRERDRQRREREAERLKQEQLLQATI